LKKFKLGQNIYNYTARELADYFEKQTTKKDNISIDFIEFSHKHIVKLREENREPYAHSINTSLNAFIDFVKTDSFDIKNITSKTLSSFDEFLRKPRTIKRLNQFNKEVKTESKGLNDMSVKDYMTNLRTLFNEAIDYYNDADKDEVLITHYPFKKYKVGPTPDTEKKALEIEDIKAIRDLPDSKVNGGHGTNRMNLSRDLLMLSFYLVGMNSVDLYSLEKISGDRIDYKRSKTKGRRQDEAFISIKIEPEALPLIEKYKDMTGKRAFCFYQMYSTSQIFSSNISKGLKQVAEKLEIEPFTYYAARHSWATIGRNVCKISKDDIHEALNHSSNMKVTDTYIKKDWSIIDEANRKVLNCLL
jgi:integrase